MSFTAFIRNIPFSFQNEDLQKALETFGEVKSARIVTTFRRYLNKRVSLGIGFVDFAQQSGLDAAVAAKTLEAGNRKLKILVARPRRVVEDNIFVGTIAQGVTDETLKQHFEKFHPVAAKVVYNFESEERRGFGFVHVASKADRDAAVHELDKSTLNGKQITARIARRPFLSDEEAQRRKDSRNRRRRRAPRRAPRTNAQAPAPSS